MRKSHLHSETVQTHKYRNRKQNKITYLHIETGRCQTSPHRKLSKSQISESKTRQHRKSPHRKRPKRLFASNVDVGLTLKPRRKSKDPSSLIFELSFIRVHWQKDLFVPAHSGGIRLLLICLFPHTAEVSGYSPNHFANTLDEIAGSCWTNVVEAEVA